MLFSSITSSFAAYRKKPVSFILATLTFIFFSLLSVLSLVGVFLIFFVVLSLVNFDSEVLVLGVLGLLLAIIALYLLSAFKGALIKSYSLLSAGSNISFLSIFRYALSSGPIFFVLCMLKVFFIVLFNLPIILFYFLYLKQNPVQYLDALLGIVALFVAFIVDMFMFPSFISAASSGTGVGKSLSAGLRLFARKHALAFALFSIYSIVWLCALSPILALLAFFAFGSQYLLYSLIIFLPLGTVSLLVSYPVAYSAMIVFFQKYAAER